MKTVHQNDIEIADADENIQHLNDDEQLEELPSMVYNIANQSQVSAMQIESEVSISFQPSESDITSPFPTLEPSNLPAASFSNFPIELPAALTAASSSSFLTDLPTALTAASSSSLLTDPSAAPTAASSSSVSTDQPGVSTVISASRLSKILR